MVVDDLVHGHHDAVAHQLLDDIYGTLIDNLSQVLYSKGLG